MSIESHIIPKFVYDWLKDTFVTGRIRSGGQPNIPVQDGIKTVFEKYYELLGRTSPLPKFRVYCKCGNTTSGMSG